MIAAVHLDLPTLVSMLVGGGVGTFLLGVWKARPEKDALVIQAKQGGAEILDTINQALQRELERKDREIARLQAALKEARDEAQRIREM